MILELWAREQEMITSNLIDQIGADTTKEKHCKFVSHSKI